MKPITLTPIFGRIFDAMDARDRARAWIVNGGAECAPTAHGAGSFQIDVGAGTYVVSSGAFDSYLGGNITPGPLVNPNASRCDLIYLTAGGVLNIGAGVEVVVTPNTPAVPPALPVAACPIALAYITPGAVDYGVATSAFVEDIRQFYAPMFLPDGTAGAPGLPFGISKNTGLFRPGAGIIALAAGSSEVMRWDAGTGHVRIPQGFGHYQRNAANSADIELIRADGGDAIQIAEFGQTVTVAGNTAFNGSFTTFGALPAQSGLIRISNAAYEKARNAANNADISLIGLDGSNNMDLGDAGFAMSVIRLNANSIGVPGFNALAAGGVIRSNSTTSYKGRNAANSADIHLIGLDGSNNIQLGPITTAGDLILGGTAGIATRLAIGSAGQVLTVSGGTAVWAAAGAGTRDTGSFSDNTTAIAATATVTKTVTVATGRIIAYTGVTKTAGAGNGVVAHGSTATADAVGIRPGNGTAVSMRNFDTALGDVSVANTFGQGAGIVELQDFWINGTALTWTFKNFSGANADTLDARAYGVTH